MIKFRLKAIGKNNEYDNDFLLLPVPVIAYQKGKKSKAYAVGIKFGFWAVYFAMLWWKN